MEQMYTNDLAKVLKNKSKLERELKIKITNKGKDIFVNGKPENEYLAIQVLEAINLGFSTNRALLLKDEENLLQIINIKDITKRKDIKNIKARIIGTYGGTLTNLSNLSDCAISLNDNQVGIIGHVECLGEAVIAIESLIRGSRQANVYARLEKKKKERRLMPQEPIINEFDKEENL